MARILVWLVTILSVVVVQGYAIAGDIVSEIKQVRRTSKAADLDVSVIATKYIPLGTDRRTVELFLKNNRFSVHQIPAAAHASQNLLAIYSETGLFKLISSDEIRVVVEFVDDKADKVSGMLILRTL